MYGARERRLPPAVVRALLLTVLVPLIGIAGFAVRIWHPWHRTAQPDDAATAMAARLTPDLSSSATKPAPIPSNPGPSTPSPAASSSRAEDPREQARSLADALRTMHQQRQAIQPAIGDAANCGAGLAADAATLTGVADARTALASTVETLAVDALPGGADVVSTAVQALRGSADADSDFAAWVADLRGHCSAATATANAHYQAAMTASAQVTAVKKTLVAQWSPIAQQYGLDQWKDSDL